MKFLVNSLFATTLLALAPCAQALSLPDQPSEPQNEKPIISPTKPGLHLVLNGGLTYGGDTIYTATYTDGTSHKIKGGSLIQLGVGGLWQFDQAPVALMLSANYHFDTSVAKNANVVFRRSPIEMLAYYTGKERLRIGGGVRIVNSPKTTATVNGLSETLTFDNTTGIVAEVGYQLETRVWLNMRFVSEKYQGKTFTSGGTTYSLAGTAPYSGSHLGVNFSYQF